MPEPKMPEPKDEKTAPPMTNEEHNRVALEKLMKNQEEAVKYMMEQAKGDYATMRMMFG